MFENMTKEQARDQILQLVGGYYEKFHKRSLMKKGTGFPMHPECMMQRKCRTWWTVRWSFGLHRADIQMSLKKAWGVSACEVLFPCELRFIG